MKLGSLFDGSGTCPLAASAVGIKPAWASEIEPFPMAVTQSRFPNMTHLGDITKMDGSKIEPVDVITFGSPCQNLSIAGNRKGLAGEQSSLFLEAVRVISEMRCATNGRYPQIAIWENVYGAFSSTQGKDFRTVLETLWQICEGGDSVPRFEEDRSGRQKWPKRGSSWEIIPLSLGEDLTLNFGESPKDASVCSLFSILEDNVPDRYFLSVTACKGILRRSEERGKPLDPLLKQALLNTIVFMQSKITPKTSGCPSDQITSSKPSQDAWAQGGGNVPLILVPCYGQTSYDEYQPSEQSTTLKASGGNYGGVLRHWF